jgi:hypothetical protein
MLRHTIECVAEMLRGTEFYEKFLAVLMLTNPTPPPRA